MKFRANYEYKDNPNMDLNELLNNYLIKMDNKQRFSDFIYNITGSNERSDLKILATSYIRPPMDFLSAGVARHAKSEKRKNAE